MEHLKNKAKALLESRGKAKTYAHCSAVADIGAELAARFGLDKDAAYCAGILHDVSAYIPPAEMTRYALDNGWEIDEAERRHPFLLHGRMSAVVAREQFGIKDAAALDAISCHSTLRANPTALDMVLFLSDKISWDQEGEPPFIELVAEALEHSLERASLVYIDYVLANGMILYPHKWLLEAKDWLGKPNGKE